MTGKYKGLPVLITGGAGFIGSCLVKRLAGLGADVRILSRSSEGSWRLEGVPGKIKIIKCDLLNLGSVRKAVAAADPVKIFHLAGNVDKAGDVSSLMSANYIGTVNLVTAASELKAVDCLISTGSSEEYGRIRPPFKELQKEKPESFYAVSKLAATEYCRMVYRSSGLPVVILRPFLTYGPFQGQGMFLPSLIRACLTGKDFPMTEGTQTREFNYVDDIVEGFLKAALSKKARGEVINLGSGVEYTVKEVAELVRRMTGSKIKLQAGLVPIRRGEALRHFCSPRKAKKLLGWEHSTSLEEGLKETINWFRENLK